MHILHFLPGINSFHFSPKFREILILIIFEENENENEPVIGIGDYQTLSDSFIVHIEALQLQMDQLKSETDQLKAKLHETESENQELKIKMNEIENLIISDKTIDVVKGRFKVF